MSDTWDGTQGYDDWAQTGIDLWNASSTVSSMGDQLWYADQTYDATVMSQASYDLEWASNEAYSNAWDAYSGAVNAEGYTAYDASMGYTTIDTSLIEPASAASSTSLISDYDTSSTL